MTATAPRRWPFANRAAARRHPLALYGAAAVAPAVAFVAYVPVVAVSYAFLDDYAALAATHGLGRGGVLDAASGGRLISGALADALFSNVDLNSLRFIRLVGVVGAALVGLLLQYALWKKGGLNVWIAAAVAATIVTLPSFQVYVAWAGLFHAPYAALAAGLAWLVLSSSFTLDGRTALLRQAGATGLLFCALLTYQPAAMFFWVFAAIELFRPDERLARALWKFARSVAVAIAAMAVAYVVMRVAAHFHGAVTNGRTTLTHDVVGKLQWFLQKPLLNALNLFALVPKWTTAAATGILALVGIVVLHRARAREAVGFVGLAVAFMLLSYLPNLVVGEEWPSYRSLGALSALVMLYCWLGLWGVARAAFAFVRGTGARRLLVGVAGGLATAFVAVSVVLAARNVSTLFAKTESVEVHLLRSALQPSRVSGVRRIVFIKPKRGASPLYRYDEFGYASSYSPDVPVPAVLLVMREHGEPLPSAIDVLAWQDARRGVPRKPRALVVDMRKLAEHQVKWTFWALHGATG